ncbi:MAG: distal tail protein Dit [Bacillaceae bacterium]
MIKIDNYPLSKWKLSLVGQITNPATADIKNNLMEIPGMNGAWDFGSTIGTRSFNIPVVLKEKDVHEKQRLIREFVAFLMDKYGRPREVKLTFDYDADKFYLVKLNGQIDPERLFRMNRFELSFIAKNPYSHFVVPSSEVSWDSDIPFMNDVLFNMDKTEYTITKPQVITLVYSGSVAIRAGFILKGSGTNVQVSANGRTMQLGNMNNTTYEVDGLSYSIKKNGKEDIVSHEFIELQHGENKVTVTGTNLNLKFIENLTYQFL